MGRVTAWHRIGDAAAADVIDQHTRTVIRFGGERICDMRYYESFRQRHPELPKFAAKR